MSNELTCVDTVTPFGAVTLLLLQEFSSCLQEYVRRRRRRRYWIWYLSMTSFLVGFENSICDCYHWSVWWICLRSRRQVMFLGMEDLLFLPKGLEIAVAVRHFLRSTRDLRRLRGSHLIVPITFHYHTHAYVSTTLYVLSEPTIICSQISKGTSPNFPNSIRMNDKSIRQFSVPVLLHIWELRMVTCHLIKYCPKWNIVK